MKNSTSLEKLNYKILHIIIKNLMGVTMPYNCPVCGKIMVQGYIPITNLFVWLEKPQCSVIGGIVLEAERGKQKHIPKNSVGKGIMRNYEAYLCQECKKVLIDYE
jgi:hypothetical protein